MAAIVYEGMFILDSNHYGRDPEAVSGRISTMIEKLDGEILVGRLWEERRLAYAIKGQRKGTYWLTYFRLDSGRLDELRRQCQITEDILRVLFLKVDPRIVDALVSHAMAVPAGGRSGEEVKIHADEVEDVDSAVDAEKEDAVEAADADA